MIAQELYDWRDETGAISGLDLHELFQALTGDPSPVGRTKISLDKLRTLAEEGWRDAQAVLDALA